MTLTTVLSRYREKKKKKEKEEIPTSRPAFKFLTAERERALDREESRDPPNKFESTPDETNAWRDLPHVLPTRSLPTAKLPEQQRAVSKGVFLGRSGPNPPPSRYFPLVVRATTRAAAFCQLGARQIELLAESSAEKPSSAFLARPAL